MINRKLLRNLSLVIALLSAASVVAWAGSSDTMTLTVRASLDGVQLKPGQYKVSWETRSPEATVTISQGRKTFVTARGRIEERDVKYKRNMVVYRTNSDGSNTIIEIRFRGKNQVLVFGD